MFNTNEVFKQSLRTTKLSKKIKETMKCLKPAQKDD